MTSAGKLLPGGKSADLGSVVSAAIIAKAAMPVMSVGGDVLKAGKSVFGAQESLGGASLAGTILGSANAGTGLMGLGANAAIGLGAGNLSATASLGAGALGALGLGAIAGGATGGVSAISGIIDLYKAQRSNDEEYQKAYTSAGAAKLTGVAGGAAAGAMIGSIIPLIPGVPFTNGIRDLVDGDYIAGSVRLLDAMLAVLCVAIGVGVIFIAYHRLWGGAIL